MCYCRPQKKSNFSHRPSEVLLFYKVSFCIFPALCFLVFPFFLVFFFFSLSPFCAPIRKPLAVLLPSLWDSPASRGLSLRMHAATVLLLGLQPRIVRDADFSCSSTHLVSHWNIPRFLTVSYSAFPVAPHSFAINSFPRVSLPLVLPFCYY